MELARRLRKISSEDARHSYELLSSRDCEENPRYSTAGLKLLDYFFLGHRLMTKIKHRSFAETMRNPEQVEFLTALVRKYKASLKIDYSDPEDLLPHQYAVFQLYYGTVNQFRPAVARWAYCHFSPKVGILDFSAGWGGRALAAMSLGIPYIGIDANTKLESSYRRMIEFIKPVSDITMRFQPSETVDFSEFNYDLILTSPPYFMLEEYENMPEYGSKEAFLNKFFRVTVSNAWKSLRTGGHMALNMPHDMYMAIRDLLPPIKKRIRMMKRDRHSINAAAGKKIGETKKSAHELIYIWQKNLTTSRKTRKHRKPTHEQ